MGILSWLAFKLTIESRMNNLRKLFPEAKIYPTGSRYVCDPPVLFTDIDFLVFSKDDLTDKMTLLGYKASLMQEYMVIPGWDFSSWRKGKINLIISDSENFVTRHRIATDICKKRNLRFKVSRVLVHELVRGPWYEGAEMWFPTDLDASTRNLIQNFHGPHGNTICQMYKIQHGLD
jgi:hypothetical protein